MTPLINLYSEQLRFTGIVLNNPHRIFIPRGVSVLVGPNGGGKTSLAKVLEEGWNYMTNHIESAAGSKLKIKRVEFNDIHTLCAYRGEYYQQRFESTVNDDMPTVSDILGASINSDSWREISGMLGISCLCDKKINYLSSGELRKILISTVLSEHPDLLILDNPYIGLDAPSRSILDTAIQSMAQRGVSIMLLVGCADEIPEYATFVIPVKDMTIGTPSIRSNITSQEEFRNLFHPLFDFSTSIIDSLLTEKTEDMIVSPGDEIVRLAHCQVRYGSNILLNDVSWTIRHGECWSLTGPNGAGKSTLLSLINADNPQAYSNEIFLFGHRRGTGESIWDIKNRIGYISPEKHLYFNAYNDTVLDVVTAGLKNALDHYKPSTESQTRRAMLWLEQLKITHLADRKFTALSFGEQRMVLLAHTLIKNPLLMILDEPLHGLDAANKLLVNNIVNHIIKANQSTLIYVTHYEGEIPSCVTHTKRLTPLHT